MRQSRLRASPLANKPLMRLPSEAEGFIRQRVGGAKRDPADASVRVQDEIEEGEGLTIRFARQELETAERVDNDGPT